jgi:hypothetical protein
MMYQIKKFFRDVMTNRDFKYDLDDVMMASTEDFEVIVKTLVRKNDVRSLQKISKKLTQEFNDASKRAQRLEGSYYYTEQAKAKPYSDKARIINIKKSILIRHTAQMGSGN